MQRENERLNIKTHYFKPLEHDAFFALEHAPSLKGLFKGKGAQSSLASEYEELRDQLICLGREHVLKQVKAYPFALLPIELAMQTTGAGTAFLRWRKRDRSAMGVYLWDEIMKSASVSTNLTHDLYAIEIERITLNMQISVVHTIVRRLKECAEKEVHANEIYQKRIIGL